MSDTSSIVVLHVDNDCSLLDLTATFLVRESERLDLCAATSGANALSVLHETEIDCIVSDYEIPEMDSLVGDLAFDYIHPDDRQHVMETFYRALEDPTITPTITYRFRNKNGSWHYLETTGENHLTDPAVEGLVLNSRDVTELRRMKEERNEILTRMTDAFLAVDDECRFTYLNRRAEQILTRTASEIIGEVIWETFPDTDDTVFYDGFHEAMRTQKPTTFEGYFEPLDSWFEANVYPSNNGLSVYLRDVSKRKTREGTLEALHDGSRELMQAETTTDVSELAVRTARDVLELPITGIWGYERGEFKLIARTTENQDEYGDATSVSDRSATLNAYETGETVISGTQLDDDGTEAFVPLGEHGVMTFGGEGLDEFDVYYAQLLAANTAAALDRAERKDERKANQRELERQIERLEEFANVVSHDLRNPLNVAQGYLDMDRATDDRERMVGIVKDVLTLARQGQTVSETEPVCGSKITMSAWASVDTGSATLDASWQTTIHADASCLQQVLENLFRNDIEHAGSDVTVSVGELDSVAENEVIRDAEYATGTASTRTAAAETARATADARTTKAPTSEALAEGFYVEDDAPGIPNSSREMVFETGNSTAETGTGFGLPIVKQIADAYGWDLSLDEADGGGTRFEFSEVELAME